MPNNPERRIINSCHTCRTPIYEGEPIYTSSKGQSSVYTKGAYAGKVFGSYGGYEVGGHAGHHSGTYASENWAQCAWCYDQWQAEVAANKSFWIKWWLGGILFIIVATIISIMMFPGLESTQSGTKQAVPWHRTKVFSLGSWQISLLAILVPLVGITLVSFLGSIFQPSVDRYKLRKQPNKL
ncbi:MAG: hypothetical protein MRERV_21c037 [Mycoplasmataceae bacterium RV_VA103A]|nr:MAG: hypothetical protein MRERV_21c037 [Mycoplasmataceae bacterium RV_VA103A]